MARADDKLTVIFQKGNKRMVVKSPLNGNRKVVVVLNSQFTNAPNTTQISSGAGRSSAAGNNASIDSTNTQQQQAVGAGGKAKNRGMKGKQVGEVPTAQVAPIRPLKAQTPSNSTPSAEEEVLSLSTKVQRATRKYEQKRRK